MIFILSINSNVARLDPKPCSSIMKLLNAWIFSPQDVSVQMSFS